MEGPIPQQVEAPRQPLFVGWSRQRFERCKDALYLPFVHCSSERLT